MTAQGVTDEDPAEDESLAIFADRLSAALARARMSQKDLAGRVGRSEGAVSRWIGEGRLPSVKTIRRIAEVTGASMDWLLDLPDASPPPIRIDPTALKKLGQTAAALLEGVRGLEADLAEEPQPVKRATRTKR